MILPALSLSQPWAEMVFDPAIDKNIENRVWNCLKRGPLLIHAAQGMTDRSFESAMAFAANALDKPVSYGGIRYVPDSHLDRHVEDAVHDTSSVPLATPRRGGIVGAAEILDVVPLDRLHHMGGPKNRSVCRHTHADSPWLMDGCYGFVLGKRVRLPFRAYSGRQRWFPVALTADEERTLREAGMVLP